LPNAKISDSHFAQVALKPFVLVDLSGFSRSQKCCVCAIYHWCYTLKSSSLRILLLSLFLLSP